MFGLARVIRLQTGIDQPNCQNHSIASAGAHPDFLNLQVEFYDLARQLKAELDSKMVAVNQLTKEYDAAAMRLN